MESDIRTNAVHPTPWFTALFRRFGLWDHPQDQADFDPSAYGDDDPAYAAQQRSWWEKSFLPGESRAERYRICDDMDNGLVASILDVWAEETTQLDYMMKRSVWVTSPNPTIQKHCEAALAAALLEDRITSMARVIAKRGDDFWRTVYQAGVGLRGITRASARDVERIEDPHSRLVGFRQKDVTFRGALKRDTSYPWDYIHFKMLGGKNEQTSYGTGVCDAMFQPWRKMVLCEDSVLMYRLRRAPDRNMILVDVNSLPEDEAVDYVNMFRKSFRKQEFVDPACLTLDTKIRTLSGDMTLQQVIDAFERKDQVWVYGYDERSRTVIPAPVTWAGVTRKNATLVEVQIDDGFVLRCTPDHPIAVMNGSQPKRGPKVKGVATGVRWVEAKDLKVGDQLVPLRKGSHLKGQRRMYETILDPFGGWGFVHSRVVAAVKAMADAWASCRQPQCHHVDEDVANNHPSNLRVLEAVDHIRLHSAAKRNGVTLTCHVCRAAYVRAPSALRRVRSDVPLCSRACWRVAGKKNDPSKNSKMQALYCKMREEGNVQVVCSGCNVEFVKPKSAVGRAAVRGQFCSRACYSKTRLALRERECGYCGSVFHARPGKQHTQKFCSPVCGVSHRVKRDAGLVPVPNHSVVAVRTISQRCDTGDLTVAATSNFFVADRGDVGGFLVHNSTGNYRKQYNPLTPVEDIFLPIRGQNNSTRIETMSGSAAQDSLADLDHYRRAFFGTGRVPQAFLGYEGDLNSRSTLTAQDVRFARGAKRLQRALIYGVRSMTDLHLSLLPAETAKDGLSSSYNPEDPASQYLINMAPINALDEFEQGELVKLRGEILGTYATVGEALKLDTATWASYLLLNYGKLSEPQVKKLVTRALPTEGKPDEMASLGSAGFGSLTKSQHEVIAEAVHSNPRLRKVLGDLADAANDLPSASYTLAEQVYLQTDKSLSMPTGLNVTSNDTFSAEMRTLLEDVAKLKR